MLNFAHFLVTRVNLGYLEGKEFENFNKEEWLDYRLDLFYKYAFPSVVNQTNKNFQWWIYFDISTPEIYKFKINEQLKGHKFISIFYKKGSFGDLVIHLKNDLKLTLSSNIKYLITTRIDSDDLIHMDIVDKIQDKFKNQKFASINFNRGFVYDVSTGVLASAINLSNPFISLIEQVHNFNFRTVYCQEHSRFIKQNKHLQVSNKVPLWCMTIHGTNYDTRFFGRPFLFKYNKLNNHFNFHDQKKPKLSDRIYFFKLYLFKQTKKIWPYILRKFWIN